MGLFDARAQDVVKSIFYHEICCFLTCFYLELVGRYGAERFFMNKMCLLAYSNFLNLAGMVSRVAPEVEEKLPKRSFSSAVHAHPAAQNNQKIMKMILLLLQNDRELSVNLEKINQVVDTSNYFQLLGLVIKAFEG